MRYQRRQFYVAFVAQSMEGDVITGMNVARDDWDIRRRELQRANFNIVAVHHAELLPETPETLKALLGPKLKALGSG